MIAPVKIILPWPPALSAMQIMNWDRKTKSHSKKAEEYYAACHDAVSGANVQTLRGCFRMRAKLYPPTMRGYDVDNRLKAILDALVHTEVVEDDCLCNATYPRKYPPDKANPRVEISIYSESDYLDCLPGFYAARDKAAAKAKGNAEIVAEQKAEKAATRERDKAEKKAAKYKPPPQIGL